MSTIVEEPVAKQAAPEGEPFLQVQGLVKLFGRVRAVDRVSFDAQPGEFLTLLGPSGCGKTTTLRMIAGLERPDEGEITVGGELIDVAARSVFVPPEKRDMGMVFQSYAIWPHMTVFENVAFPLRRASGRRAREVASACAGAGHGRLAGFADRPATQLSGGQQQRVALARALVVEPERAVAGRAVQQPRRPAARADARWRWAICSGGWA